MRQELPTNRKLVWLVYLALAVACLCTALVTLIWFSGVGILVHNVRGLVLALGTFALMCGGVVSAVMLAFQRRIYWAWAAIAVAYVPWAVFAGLSSLQANS